MRQWFTENIWVRKSIGENVGLQSFWISNLGWGTLLCISELCFSMAIVEFFFPFSFDSSSLYFFHLSFKGKVWKFLPSSFVWQIIMKRRKEWEGVRGMFLWIWERVKKRNNEFLCGVWVRHQSPKWESVSSIHSDILCRHLQTLQDQMVKMKLLTWLTISRSKFADKNESRCSLSSARFCLFLILKFPGSSSKSFI